MTLQNNRITRALLIASVFMAAAAGYAGAQDKVPAEFQGDWVPATGACTSLVRFRVAESQMTLINGKDTASYGNLGTTATYFGNEYNGISVVFLPELNSGNPPFTVFFNADEKKASLKWTSKPKCPAP